MDFLRLLIFHCLGDRRNDVISEDTISGSSATKCSSKLSGVDCLPVSTARYATAAVGNVTYGREFMRMKLQTNWWGLKKIVSVSPGALELMLCRFL